MSAQRGRTPGTNGAGCGPGAAARLSRRSFVAGVLAGLAAPGLARALETSLRPVARPEGGPASLSARFAEIVRARSASGALSFSIVDMESGRELASASSRAPLPPASAAKAITAAYALEALGPESRFETRLVADGPASDGVIDGDLILAGGGDPTLDTDSLAEMLDGLALAGVREVRGRLRPWGGALPYTHEISRDQPDHVSYNTSTSGLSLNHNRVYFEWARSGGGYRVSMDARTLRHRPEVRSARMTVAAPFGSVFAYEDGGDHDAWRVSRDALGDGGARWLPVRKPAIYAAEVLSVLAAKRGLALRTGPPLGAAPAGRTLVSRQSDDLRAILRAMLEYSNNLTAELVGMSATARRGGRPESLADSARAMSGWGRSRLGMAACDFVDHSGLSDASQVTALSMARGLAAPGLAAQLRPILQEIPLDRSRIAGRPRGIEVAAKTGTLHYASTLAGYMTTASGRQLSFAILAADLERRAGIDKSAEGAPRGATRWKNRAKYTRTRLLERAAEIF